MKTCLAYATAFFLLFGDQTDKPWQARLSDAVEAAHRDGAAASYGAALDIAWRADDWQVGLDLTREAQAKWPDLNELRARQARALWRAGRLSEAEVLAGKIAPDTIDQISLRVLIVIDLARGKVADAAAHANRLENVAPLTAEDLFTIREVRIAQDSYAGLAKLTRRAQELADAAKGYPETYLVQRAPGLADFLEAVGEERVNQVTRFGSADMPVLPVGNLPTCQVFINGCGPYLMLVDTGGGAGLTLTRAVAAEVGLKSIATGALWDVSGKQECGRMLVKELKIGGIGCQRVIATEVESTPPFEGLIGTGVFGAARMTLDFAAGRLRVDPAAEEPAQGQEVPLRLAGPYALLVPVLIEGDPVLAKLDSGAAPCALAPSFLKRKYPGRESMSIATPSAGAGNDKPQGVGLPPPTRLEFAGRVFADCGAVDGEFLDTVVGPLEGVQSDALLGMSVLREARSLTVDFPHCRMWVQWGE